MLSSIRLSYCIKMRDLLVDIGIGLCLLLLFIDRRVASCYLNILGHLKRLLALFTYLIGLFPAHL